MGTQSTWGLISRVSSRTYSKTGKPGVECLVYKTSAKARELSTPSKSPTSPSYNCNYFQEYHSSTNSPVRYKTQSLRKHHSLSKITFSYELESKAKTTSSYNYSTFPCQILLNPPNTSTKQQQKSHQKSCPQLKSEYTPPQPRRSTQCSNRSGTSKRSALTQPSYKSPAKKISSQTSKS